MPKARIPLYLTVIFLFALLAACGTQATVLPTPSSTPTEVPPYWPGDEWRTSTPAEQNMDKDRLEAMVEMIEEQDLAYHSVVVVRNGYIVFEEYLNGWSQDSPHHLQSSTKSVSSLLIGTLVYVLILGGNEGPQAEDASDAAQVDESSR